MLKPNCFLQNNNKKLIINNNATKEFQYIITELDVFMFILKAYYILCRNFNDDMEQLKSLQFIMEETFFFINKTYRKKMLVPGFVIEKRHRDSAICWIKRISFH